MAHGVAVVLSSPSAMNVEFAEHFKEELLKTKNAHVKVKVINLHDSDTIHLDHEGELVIAVGVRALQAASKLKATTLVLGVFTPLPTFNALLDDHKRDLGNFSAILLDQPYARQMALMRIVLPDSKNVGLLLGPNSGKFAELLKEAGEKSNFHIDDELVQQEADLIPKLKKVLEHNDALLAIPDPLIYSRETAHPILLTSYRHQKPVFGYSQSYVRAGALAAVYSSVKQLARQAVEIALAQHSAGLLPPPQAPRYFSVTMNAQVARSLNIPLIDDETLRRKMLLLESSQNDEFRD
jgi:putative ABC transport system substrate-binding protein